MARLKAVFSKQNLPKLLLFVGIYLLGRMEGEGRFSWGAVLGSTWDQLVKVSVAAADSARGVIGM